MQHHHTRGKSVPCMSDIMLTCATSSCMCDVILTRATSSRMCDIMHTRATSSRMCDVLHTRATCRHTQCDIAHTCLQHHHTSAAPETRAQHRHAHVRNIGMHTCAASSCTCCITAARTRVCSHLAHHATPPHAHTHARIISRTMQHHHTRAHA